MPVGLARECTRGDPPVCPLGQQGQMASPEPLGAPPGRALHYFLSLGLGCHVQARLLQRADTQRRQTQAKKRASPQRERFHSNFVFIKPGDRDSALRQARGFCKDTYLLLLNIKRAADLLLALGENNKRKQLNKDQVSYFCTC